MYFFTTANVADVKLETDIVGKHLFTAKVKKIYHTLSLGTIVNVMFCNKRFPWLLAEALFTVHVNLDACYLPRRQLF